MAASTASRVDPTATHVEPDHLTGSEALRRDRTPTVIADPRSGGDGVTALGMAYIEPSTLPPQRP